MIWVFRKFAELLERQPIVYTEWNSFAQAETGHRLFVWEAFVSGRQQDAIDVLGERPTGGRKWVVKKEHHLFFDKADALTAVNAFVDRLGQATDVKTPPDATAVSLVYTVIAWLCWSTEQVQLDSAPLVRKENKPNWDAVPQLLESAGEKMTIALKECFTPK